ncbi:outer membrane beta-barrel protein [Erythrobacter sp. THAF29]|uniref:outer membrane beta-barrel protein n=1 Tax=Erythrobacter sp. THAF29 TaxID=2587851 RepID=UPI001562C982|nr:outer membrane beta-barrel protein [Erythrobacter sp. THAF29]
MDDTRRPVPHVRQPRVWLDRLAREFADLLLIVRSAESVLPDALAIAPKALAFKSPIKPRTAQTFVMRAAIFACLCMIAPRMALAQQEDVVTPVELFDPASGEGIRISPNFILYPEATVEVRYDDNLYNLDTNEIEDGFVLLRPALTLASDFGRHSVSLVGSAEFRRHFDITDEDSEQFDIEAATTLEFADGVDVDAYAGIGQKIEQRGTLGDVFFTDEPVSFIEKRGGLSIARTGGKLELSAGADIVNRDYQDVLVGGIETDLSIRDVTIRSARVRGDLGVREQTGIFVEVGGNQIDFDLATVPERDSSGFSVLVGVRHEVTALIEIEAGVGYIHQDFDDPAVDTVSDVNFRLGAVWTPKPEWRLTASATRFIDASRTLDSPAIKVTQFRIGAQRALGDRVLVGVDAGYAEESFRGLPRNDERIFVTGSTTLRVTDRIGLTASAGYREQDGGASGRDYNGFSAAVGVRAAW